MDEDRVMLAKLEALSDRVSKIERKEDEAAEVRTAVLTTMQKLESRLESLTTVFDQLPSLVKSLTELGFQVKDLQDKSIEQIRENHRRRNETVQLQAVIIGVILTAVLGLGTAIILRDSSPKSAVTSPVK
jgi:uncharacterized coiled-coil DUF342 family protein